MKVTEISYRELMSVGKYENIAIEMKASLDPADNLELCMTKLRKKVKRALIESAEDDN